MAIELHALTAVFQTTISVPVRVRIPFKGGLNWPTCGIPSSALQTPDNHQSSSSDRHYNRCRYANRTATPHHTQQEAERHRSPSPQTSYSDSACAHSLSSLASSMSGPSPSL